ncbi:sulfur carrier protein ThiS [Sulfurospirillum sp. 1612]|uniref:sulfur carrier protein ThiS n=1 Tax=Sulfurospirillum sp. 1612 TaxID=3094835 RepID=UPI002F941270
MELTLNNHTIQTEHTNVNDLIASLNLENPNVVVELNLKILKRVNWEQTLLHPGDRVEIITFMGGG